MLKPGYWERVGLKWSSPATPTPESRNLQLANAALVGLALSGKDVAGRLLKAIEDNPKVSAFGETLSHRMAVKEAVAKFEDVRTKGVSAVQ